ncbi:MAG: hypothetical protein ACTSSK_16870 [Candidatus Heimdallarchaeota archaeon]
MPTKEEIKAKLTEDPNYYSSKSLEDADLSGLELLGVELKQN